MADSGHPIPQELRQRYIELLKQCLTFSLWPEPPIPAERFLYRANRVKRLLVRSAGAVLRPTGYGLVKLRTPSAEARRTGTIWPGMAHTMIGQLRMDNLQYCLETCIREKVPGDFIETGVWRGGACIFARGVFTAYSETDRRVFVADSFQGLPEPEPEKYAADAGDKHFTQESLRVSEADVRKHFEQFGLLDDRVVFLKGWFKDTLPTAPIEQLAVLRLDGDMYSSTIEAIEVLYPKLSPGGFCIVDDYSIPGCRQAIEDYRAQHGIEEPIETIDWTGVYWRKRS